MTPVSGIKVLVSTGLIKRFSDIFRIYKHHQTLTAVHTGIPIERMRTIVDRPGEMTVPEAYQLRTYFELSAEEFCRIVDGQLNYQEGKIQKKKAARKARNQERRK